MVFRSILAAVTASFALSAFAIPTSLKVDSTSLGLVPRAAEGEPFQCPDPAGAATAKQALVGAGATTVDVAIAMLENGCAFQAAFAAGNNKVDDSAELGVYRNNWYMLRTYCSRFQGASASDWFNLGQQVHNDVGVATDCQNQLFNALGPDQFFALQRGGLGNPGAGPAYGNFVQQYENFVQAHMTDGMAIYFNVPSM